MEISIIDQGDLGKVTGTRQVPERMWYRIKDIVLKQNWAPAIFKEKRRTIATAIQTDYIVLDVDSGATVEQAEADMETLACSYALVLSKSHTKELNRFRIIIPLASPIKTDSQFKANFAKLQETLPYIDPACKDISRFFYPATTWHAAVVDKEFYAPIEAAVPVLQKDTNVLQNSTERGELWKSTLKFLLEGAAPGNWHFEMHKAVRNMREQGYTQDEVLDKMQKMCELSEYAQGVLDTHDLNLIRDVYLRRDTKYDFKPQEPSEGVDYEGQEVFDSQTTFCTIAELLDESFIYLSDKDLVKGDPTGIEGLDKLLGGGFREGEVTVLMAEAKTGKNTLYHYMMYDMLVKGIPMGYASRELDPAREVLPNLMCIHLNKNIWLSDITEEIKKEIKDATATWPLRFAKGYGYYPLNEMKNWFTDLANQGVKHFWFDHLHYALEEPEDHKAASKLIKEVKTLAKQLSIHINLIVQPNKINEYNGVRQKMGLGTIKGGSAIGQALDNLLILERVQGQKNIVKLSLNAARHKLCTLGEIYLQYNPKSTRFVEVEEKEEEVAETPSQQ